MQHIPLNGQKVLATVEANLRPRQSAREVLSRALSIEEDAPDGTNGATKHEPAVDPSQGMGAPVAGAKPDPLLEALLRTINR